LAALCPRDVDAVVSDIENTALSPGSGIHARLAFEPTYDLADWHFGSEEYVASVLLGPDRLPTVKGAATNDGPWGYWIHDYNNDTLIILRLVLPSKGSEGTENNGLPDSYCCGGWWARLRRLVGSLSAAFQPTASCTTVDTLDAELAGFLWAALIEARAWNLSKISIWDPSSEVVAACTVICQTEGSMRLELRDAIENNIPCLRWREQLGGPAEQVEWVHREMYPWC